MSRYIHVNVNGKTVAEHRLVWERANGPIPKGFEIHHIGGNSKNNDLTNLSLMTRSEHHRIHALLRKMNEDVVDPTDPDVTADRLRVKRWVKQNKTKFNATQKRYRDSHREERAQYKVEHRAELNAGNVRRRAENRERALKYEAEYRTTHREAIRESTKRFNESHRALIRAKQNLRNARIRGDSPERIAELVSIVEHEKSILRKDGSNG